MRRSLQQWLWDGFYFQVELRSLYVNFRSIKGSYLEFTTGTKVSELVNLFFPPDNQEDSESTLSSSPCLNFSGTLPSFSNCKDKFFQIHLFPYYSHCVYLQGGAWPPSGLGRYQGTHPTLARAAFRPHSNLLNCTVSMGNLYKYKYISILLSMSMLLNIFKSHRPAAGKGVAGVEIKHVRLPGKSIYFFVLIWKIRIILVPASSLVWGEGALQGALSWHLFAH